MSKKAVLSLAGPWAILVHIALTIVGQRSQIIFVEHRWFLATGFNFLAFVVIAGLSLVVFRGWPRNWPWGNGLSLFGTSIVSAVLLDTGIALDSIGPSVNDQTAVVSLVAFEVAFLSFLVVLMKAIIIGGRSAPQERHDTLTWWQQLKLAFRQGQHRVR